MRFDNGWNLVSWKDFLELIIFYRWLEITIRFGNNLWRFVCVENFTLLHCSCIVCFGLKKQKHVGHASFSNPQKAYINHIIRLNHSLFIIIKLSSVKPYIVVSVNLFKFKRIFFKNETQYKNLNIINKLYITTLSIYKELCDQVNWTTTTLSVLITFLMTVSV